MINEEGYLKEKCQPVVEKHELTQFYKCPFEEEYFEILHKFPCNTDPEFLNDTTGKLLYAPEVLNTKGLKLKIENFLQV